MLILINRHNVMDRSEMFAIVDQVCSDLVNIQVFTVNSELMLTAKYQ
jgi:hypothetical protein